MLIGYFQYCLDFLDCFRAGGLSVKFGQRIAQGRGSLTIYPQMLRILLRKEDKDRESRPDPRRLLRFLRLQWPGTRPTHAGGCSHHAQAEEPGCRGFLSQMHGRDVIVSRGLSTIGPCLIYVMILRCLTTDSTARRIFLFLLGYSNVFRLVNRVHASNYGLQIHMRSHWQLPICISTQPAFKVHGIEPGGACMVVFGWGKRTVPHLQPTRWGVFQDKEYLGKAAEASDL